MAMKGRDGKSRSTAPRRTALTAAGRPVPQLPVWVPPLAYAAVTVVLFRDFFLDGVPLLGLDTLGLSYFARDFYTEFVQQFHRMPYWNPLIFGGLPFVEGMHGDIFYPPSLAMYFIDARVMWGWKMSLHVFLAGMFAFLWLRRGLELDRAAAFFGGLVFMMGANMISLVLPGGDGKLFVSALAPLLFWLTERAVRYGRVHDFALFSLGLALALFTSHMQAAYYTVWGVSLYFLFRSWQLGRAEMSGRQARGGFLARRVGMFAVAGVLGVGAAAVQFLPPLEYLREHSHRVDRAAQGELGKVWSASWSLHAEEIVSLAVPAFVGELTPSDPARPPAGYWGKNAAKMNSEYAGLVPLLLLPVLLLRRRTPQVWFFTGLGVLTLLYGLAGSTPLFHLFYLIPGVSLFRAWSMIIFLYGFALATLGAIAVQQLLEWLADGRAEDDRAGARRILWVVAGVFGALALLQTAGIITSAWQSVFGADIRADRLEANLSYIATGFWIAGAIAAAVAAAWELAVRDVLRPAALVAVLAAIAAADLYRVSRPFVDYTVLMNRLEEGGTLFQPDESILLLQQFRDRGAPFRVFDLSGVLRVRSPYGENDLAVHGLEQLAGHHGNEIGRYRNLIGGEMAANLGAANMRLADVTNTEYFLAPGRVEHPKLEEVHIGSQSVIYRNRDVLPRAYLVGATEVVPGSDAILRLLDERFDPRTTAILAEPLPAGAQPEPGASGTVEWVDREVDRFTLRVTADRAALLIVLDNWYPAWQATVDGVATPVHRANHTFRAVPVAAGTHTVQFRYAPTALRTGAFISLAVLLLLMVALVVGVLGERRRRTSDADAGAAGAADAAGRPAGPAGAADAAGAAGPAPA